MNLKSIAKLIATKMSSTGMKVAKWGSKHAPSLCTGVGLVGMGGTMWMVHKSSPRYHEAVNVEGMKGTEKAKTALKIYWPSLLSFGASSACIIAGNRISNKRYLALASAASLAQKELLNTQESILESMGPEALKTVKEKVAEKRNNDISEDDIIVTGKGDVLYYEPLTGHYFKSSENEILRVVNEMNAHLLSEEAISLDTLLSDWGIEIPGEVATALYFTVDPDVYGRGMVDVDFTESSVKVNGVKKLCWEISYTPLPRGEYPFPFKR